LRSVSALESCSGRSTNSCAAAPPSWTSTVPNDARPHRHLGLYCRIAARTFAKAIPAMKRFTSARAALLLVTGASLVAAWFVYRNLIVAGGPLMGRAPLRFDHAGDLYLVGSAYSTTPIAKSTGRPLTLGSWASFFCSPHPLTSQPEPLARRALSCFRRWSSLRPAVSARGMAHQRVS
jgi:hypothetical protein